MSLNTAHANNGVLLHAGESILLFCDNVIMSFSGLRGAAFDGEKNGRLYLTTHRMVFNNKGTKDEMKSFSFPFVALRNVELEQPVFGANYIKGKVLAQPNGGFEGEAKFKLRFKSGGAIDFGTAMLKAAQMAATHARGAQNPPPYTPPDSAWYAAPPPAYSADPNGYGGWIPPTNVFPEQPPANSVFMTDLPPPYPGINGYSGYASNSNGAGGFTAPPSEIGYASANHPQTVFIPAPEPNELPPSCDDSMNKKNN